MKRKKVKTKNSEYTVYSRENLIFYEHKYRSINNIDVAVAEQKLKEAKQLNRSDDKVKKYE
jgi:hypothetical protein